MGVYKTLALDSLSDELGVNARYTQVLSGSDVFVSSLKDNKAIVKCGGDDWAVVPSEAVPIIVNAGACPSDEQSTFPYLLRFPPGNPTVDGFVGTLEKDPIAIGAHGTLTFGFSRTALSWGTT
eukprot:CAMPEP_0176094250 /NCGR_PEP_ID=MMETSP0120_2-20121206/47230_1 /TAXON_ID=160619 /ORGANISM="Kryptoperidinium foliaceum, Strain CCMP 1326" /LENGTH=122 /DNA_ID=CAMNT_0017428193 /DNA_START=126 /DNA_END=490 /DNA_ORIENTATION=-